MSTTAAIYMEGEGNTLSAVTPRKYEREDVLEALVARHPNLVSDCLQEEDTTPWLWVATQVGIANRVGNADHFQADILFVGGDGTPTIVEVKRSTDTRIRREVVGQMLDYAVNALRYWPPGRWRELFQERVGSDADRILRTQVGAVDIERFWAEVDANLDSQNLRMILLADHVPSEMRRIVDFLNDDSKNLEFVGIEVRPYTLGLGAVQTKLLVPHLVAGQRTVDAPRRMAEAKRRPQWEEQEFLDQVPSGKARELVREFMMELRSTGKSRLWFGSGATHASLTPRPLETNQGCLTVYPRQGGVIEFKLSWNPKDAITEPEARSTVERHLEGCFVDGALSNILPGIWESYGRKSVPIQALREPDGPRLLARWVEGVHSALQHARSP